MKKEKRQPHQLATRVARSIWPAKRSMQRVGVLVLGLCALIGVTQASNVQKLFLGSAGSSARTQTLAATTSAPATSAAITSTTSETEPTEIDSSAPNIVDLVGDSELIIRGAVSEGMLCSARELGLGTDHQGILAFDVEAEPGDRFLDVMPVGDTRLVVDVMPNRPDLLSHQGLAREIAAATGKQLHRPTHPPRDAHAFTRVTRSGKD